MSTCNSVNLVKGSGLKTILSFCNNTHEELQNNVTIISLNSVPDFYPSSPCCWQMARWPEPFPALAAQESCRRAEKEKASLRLDLFQYIKNGCTLEPSASFSHYSPMWHNRHGYWVSLFIQSTYLLYIWIFYELIFWSISKSIHLKKGLHLTSKA